ncbi:MAG TPA: high-affinity iron transporter [Verrucomicrobia bacterium]|nr:FTR1 family protein [Candidatus Woesearchaeota archaeon]HBA85621.1 high-affinity iron transporter [Verrucomicrobiota bacterium]
MLESFLITSRETLEASLVVGIVFGYLNRTSQHSYKRVVYYGIAAGVLLSMLAALLFISIAGEFAGRAEEIFEGMTMMVAAVLLTTMILWMLRQQRIARQLESRVASHIQKAQVSAWGEWGLFLLVLIAVLREGVETVIFFGAISYSSGVSLLGGLLGVAAAIAIGYFFFVGTRKVNLRRFFHVSSVLLILFAAGLVAHGVHEFEEAGLVNGVIAPVWDINPVQNADGSYPALHEKGAVGSFLVGLFGYNGNPSLVEVLAYAAYLGAIYVIYRRIELSKGAGATQ